MEAALKKLQNTIEQNLKKVGGGARFFSASSKRGESVELQADLASSDRDRQKNALKRIIANMTVGRDVSQLFVDVVKLGQTPNLEVKKLVYLYVLSTAKLQPDKALLAVNTFLQDSTHSSPIIRALALRTMMCLRVESVLEYTLDPLRKALSDSDPYVRKTAAVAIGKLFHQNTKIFEEQGFLDLLEKLVFDPFPIVTSNAAVILCEISASGKLSTVVRVKKQWVPNLLSVLPDCTEWGQVYVLEALATYLPDADEVDSLLERVKARTQHASSAVVLAAVKCIANWCHKRYCNNPEVLAPFLQRITNALLTLAASNPPTQFVVLRNVQLLLNLFPSLLGNNLDSFYIRFTDPTYVKLEKLSLMLRLVTPATSAAVVNELTEYSNEVDPIFMLHVIDAISRAAVKVESVAQRCCDMLLKIVSQRPEFLPAVVCAAKNIVRKYPPLFLDIVSPLIADHGAANVIEDEAKVAFVWMLGEFCDFIENGSEILTKLLGEFLIQQPSIQLALVTAVVKVFLRNPSQMEKTLRYVLDVATKQAVSPDLRDRAFLYYRLLAKGIGAERMKAIVHGRKAPVNVDQAAEQMTPTEQLKALNSAAAVFGVPQRTFVAEYGLECRGDDDDEDEDVAEAMEAPSPAGAVPVTMSSGVAVDPLGALFGEPAAAAGPHVAPKEALPLLLPSDHRGTEVRGSFSANHGSLQLSLQVTNKANDVPLKNFAIQFNTNALAIVPASQLAQPPTPLAKGGSFTFIVDVTTTESHLSHSRGLRVEVGLKTEPTGVLVFQVTPPNELLFGLPPLLERSEFSRQWQAIDPASEWTTELGSGVKALQVEAFCNTVEKFRWRVVVRATTPTGGYGVFGVAKTHSGITCLWERNVQGRLTMRCPRMADVTPLAKAIVDGMTRSLDGDSFF